MAVCPCIKPENKKNFQGHKKISIWNKTSIQRNQYMYLTIIIQFSKCLYCECLKPGSWQPPDLKWIVLVLFAHFLNATAMAGRERKNKVSPSPPGWWIHRATAPDCRSYQPSSVWDTMESPTPTSQLNHYTATFVQDNWAKSSTLWQKNSRFEHKSPIFLLCLQGR